MRLVWRDGGANERTEATDDNERNAWGIEHGIDGMEGWEAGIERNKKKKETEIESVEINKGTGRTVSGNNAAFFSRIGYLSSRRYRPYRCGEKSSIERQR